MDRHLMATIDAHQHYWHTALQEQAWRTHDHAALARDFLPQDLTPELTAAGVDATVLVQSVDEHDENVRLERFAADPRVAGVVAWLPLQEPRAALAELDAIATDKVCGVRCLIADDPLDWLTSTESLTLFRELADRSLAWDVVPVTAKQTRQVIALTRAVPELRVVVDHLGRPPLESGGWEPWASHLTELAESPGVAVKLSVGIAALTAWDRWAGDELEKYVEHTCAEFGAARLMLASNWPVVLLRATYQQTWSDLGRLADRYLPGPSNGLAVRGGTAQRWYGLADPATAPPVAAS
jgi:L-fuconolactonase